MFVCFAFVMAAYKLPIKTTFRLEAQQSESQVLSFRALRLVAHQHSAAHSCVEAPLRCSVCVCFLLISLLHVTEEHQSYHKIFSCHYYSCCQLRVFFLFSLSSTHTSISDLLSETLISVCVCFFFFCLLCFSPCQRCSLCLLAAAAVPNVHLSCVFLSSHLRA